MEDLEKLENQLLNNPKLGESLGKNIYKIRLKIESKRKGKSGGAQVISCLEQEIIAAVEDVGQKTIVNLLSVYDKSDRATISDKELKTLVENIEI